MAVATYIQLWLLRVTALHTVDHKFSDYSLDMNIYGGLKLLKYDFFLTKNVNGTI